LIPSIIASSSPDQNDSEVDTTSNLEPKTTTVIVYYKFSRGTKEDETDDNLAAVFEDRVEKTHDSDGKPCWKVALVEGETVSQLASWSDLEIPGVDYEARKRRFTKRNVSPRPVKYWAVARDPDNIEENIATLAYLKIKVAPGAHIHGMKSLDGSLSWGPLHLSPEDILEVAQYSGIRPNLIESRGLIKCRAVAKDTREGFDYTEYDESSSQLSNTTKMISKRSITWKRQQRATRDLMEDSRYE
jgi:hypothetical protein